MIIDEKITLLKDYFAKRQDVVMAFVFGSTVKGTATTESDVDIAVYFTPKGKELEWEEAQTYYAGEDKIWGDVEKLVGRRVDLVVLNRVPAVLAATVLQEGIALAVKDHSLYLRFFLSVTSAAEDFMRFTNEYWDIMQRSRSLSDIDRQRLMRVAAFLEKELSAAGKFTDIDQQTYETNDDMRRNVERWAENIVNSSIDAAKILLASEKKRIPQTYREVLQELSLLDGFSPETAEKLSQFSKLRNILAHEYLDVRFNHITRFVRESEQLYCALVDFIKKQLGGDETRDF